MLVRIGDRAVDEPQRPRPALGLNPPSVAGKAASEIRLGALYFRSRRRLGWIGLIHELRQVSSATWDWDKYVPLR